MISTQHHPDILHKDLEEAIIEEIVKPTLPGELLANKPKYYINPTGRFVIGGPVGDCGLTGRKIIVDTYGGSGHHGGGAVSGKDPSNVDRTSSYMGRYVAKNDRRSRDLAAEVVRFRSLTPSALPDRSP